MYRIGRGEVMSEKPKKYSIQPITVNGHGINSVLIGCHYQINHGSYMNDELILQLVAELDGGDFPVDSTTASIDYYVADIQLAEADKTYRLIWLFEGKKLEILGVINAYRKTKRKKP